MNIKKPNFWDQKTPHLFAYLLLPIALIIKIFIYFKKKPDNSKMNIKTICIGNFYIGGTGKTSLCIKINQILEKRKIKSCFIKKFYKKHFNKEIKIAILGLNPHCETIDKYSEEEKIIIPAIAKLKGEMIFIKGPFSADSFFIKKNCKN